VVVISVSLSGAELEKFDRLVRHFGFDSRSSAVRDALYHFIAGHQLDLAGHQDLALTLVYTADRSQDLVNHIAHEFEDVIRTSLHNHLEATCVDVFIVHGDGTRVHALMDRLTKLKDVRVSPTPI
jgi:CopG family nickel-responsive transcriptional regulator